MISKRTVSFCAYIQIIIRFSNKILIYFLTAKSKTKSTCESSPPLSTEPGYESVRPSQNDPGYEILHHQPLAGSKKPSSDYDPNYEVLKPNPTASLLNYCATGSDDGYAKVLEKPLDDLDALDGYSKIGNPTTSLTTKQPREHDYASISNNNNNIIKDKTPSDEALKTNNYESLTGSESDPNYESVQYTKKSGGEIVEEHYERLRGDKDNVGDFFQV